MKQVTFGADPEFFVARSSAPGTAFPICGLLGGTKGKPLMVRGFGLQEDNVMAEYTIPPTHSFPLMMETVMLGRDIVLERLNRSASNDPFVSVSRPYAKFLRRILKQAGDGAYTFGCSPDFDAYSLGTENPAIPPEALTASSTSEYRFAGGHIHIGYRHIFPNIPPYVMAMMCDLTFGLNMVGFDRQGPRRAVYGTPGRHRPTPYGLEYRTASNTWTFGGSAYGATEAGAFEFERLMQESEITLRRIYNAAPWGNIRQAISGENTHLARSLLDWRDDEFTFFKDREDR